LARSKSDGRARPPGAPQRQDHTASSAQEELIAFLSSPASYPHRPADVRVIQTHISWVFIVSPFVFKVKKPLNLGFLDFSTLEKRRYFCEREVELNRRLAPEIYLGVVPIYKTAAGFSLNAEVASASLPMKSENWLEADATGRAIGEYAVKMRELPHARPDRHSIGEGGFLRELLEKNLVGEKEIKRVISTLHRFYQSENPTPEIERWGTPEKLKISTDENFAQVKPFVGQTISSAAFEATRHFTNQFCVTNKNLFHERIQQHRILDCHGDLHLDHIHLTQEATTIFDCIEFNDRFRFIDIANDLAFLAMDFDFEGRRDLANLLLRNAAREFGDPGMLKIANFYKCYRAFVRGKVESIQSIEPETLKPQEHAQQATRYFRLALQYAVTGSEPLVLVLMGRVGTGKTTVAKQLGAELDWPVFSSDQIRKKLAGVPLTERTAATLRDKIYSEQMTQQTYKKILDDGLASLANHSSVILDATFSRRENRKFLRDACAKAGVHLQVVELAADPEQIKRRLQARDETTGEISDARLEDFEKLNAAYEPPFGLMPDLIKVSATDAVADTVKAILLRLAEKEGGALSRASAAV
jgi:aminoglycoside phosphotransferase family enzyme/predicted kinase